MPTAAEPTPSSPAPELPNERTAEILRQERRYLMPDQIGSLQREHGLAPVLLAPGRHQADSLGIELTLELDEWLRLEAEEPGSFWLTRPDAPLGGLLPAVVFMRPVGLTPVNRVGDLDLFRGEQTVAPDDLGSWLDEVDQIVVVDSGDVSAGGRQGRWFDVDVVTDAGPMTFGCRPGECVHTWWSGASRSTVARDLESLRYYSFPDPAGPVYVLVAAADGEFTEWNERATRLLETMDFGPSRPHPVDPAVQAGLEQAHQPGETTGFVQFPELEATPSRFSVALQRPGLLRLQPWTSYGGYPYSELVRPVTAPDGTPIESVEQLDQLLMESGLEMLAADETLEGTTSAYEGTPDSVILHRAQLQPGDDPRFVGWPTNRGDLARMWPIDGPAGPLLAVAWTDLPRDIDQAVERTEALLSTIEFR